MMMTPFFLIIEKNETTVLNFLHLHATGYWHLVSGK